MQMELREYVVHPKMPKTFYWARYGGDNNLTVCDRRDFFNLFRWDDGGRGEMIRSSHTITLLLDSLEAKTKEDHTITIEATNKILKAVPELQPYAISVLSLGPTQVVLSHDVRDSNILSGSLFEEKHRFLRKYKNRLRGYKVNPPLR